MGAKITINIFDKEDKLLNGLNELESKELGLLFYDVDHYLVGLQSNYVEPDKKYYEQSILCEQIIKLCKQLKKVSQ